MLLLRELAVTTLLVLASGANAGFYPKNSDVLVLDYKNFDKEILQSNNSAMVEFFAPWCGHCQNLKPAYEKAAKSLKGLAKVAAIDCDDDSNRAICSANGVQGFPTLKVFQPSDKKGKPRVLDYDGPRTAKGIADKVVESIPNHVTRLTAAKLDGFLSTNNETAKAILFTTKGTTGALWKSLAIDFLGSISFAQIRDKETAATEWFGITEFPTVVLLPGGEGDGMVYGGKMEKAGLYEFFAAVKPPVKESKESKTSSKDKAKASEEASSSTEEPVPTEKPKPEIPALSDKAALVETCLGAKSKTCVLTLTADEESDLTGVTDVYEKLQSRGPPFTFQFFKLNAADSHTQDLVEKLELTAGTPTIVAVNGHRSWFRRFSGDATSAEDLMTWLDAIKLGEGKKEKLPATLTGEEEEEETKTEEVEPESVEEVQPEEAAADDEEIAHNEEEVKPETTEEIVHEEL